MNDKNKLHDKLTDLFINYQNRLENPMPSPNETGNSSRLKYMNDPLFHRKVVCLANGVMRVVNEHDGEEKWLKWNPPLNYHFTNPDDVIIYRPKCAVNFEFAVGRAEDIKWDRVKEYINLGEL